jgi:lysophospholipase L1-like esterase
MHAFRIAPPSILSLIAVVAFSPAFAQDLEDKPADPKFAPFNPVKAPAPAGLLIRRGDRLAIIGDSITEQKLYSRILETYLTACRPELGVTVRQYGWGGETAEGFKNRMVQDCLHFKPTLATTCYGMNDHRYTTYDPKNGQWYRENQEAIVRAFKAAGARFVLGSPGCVGPVVPWSKSSSEAMNLNLCELRNLDIDIAQREGVVFADVFWPMFVAGWKATNQFGPAYAIAGKDAVHPGWAGHVVMATAYLKALGLAGADLATLSWDLSTGRATTSAGHQVVSATPASLTVRSSRFPFCAPPGELKDDNAIRSGMALTDFQNQFNRFRLVATHGTARTYTVTWGGESHTFTAEQLAAGINLPAEFVHTPFDEAFKKLDDAVGRKQAYETRQIKTLFHGDEGKAEMAGTIALTEKVRKPLVAAVRAAQIPVTYTIQIAATP